MTRVYSQTRVCSARRALARCKSKCNTGSVSIVDADNGKTDVVTVDSSNPSHQGSKGGVDDEGGTVDTPKNVHDDATSKTTCPASIYFPWSEESSEESDSDECTTFVRKGNSPSKPSANMSRYRKSGSPRSRSHSDIAYESSTYGSPWSEDSSEGSDGDECQIFARKGNSPSILMENKKMYRKSDSSRNSFGLDFTSEISTSEGSWSEESNGDECPVFVRKANFPSKSADNTRMYNKSGPSGNIFGLDLASESDSPNTSDSELWL